MPLQLLQLLLHLLHLSTLVHPCRKKKPQPPNPDSSSFSELELSPISKFPGGWCGNSSELNEDPRFKKIAHSSLLSIGSLQRCYFIVQDYEKAFSKHHHGLVECARSLCQDYSGTMPMPKSYEENERIHQFARSSSGGTKQLVLLGIHDWEHVSNRDETTLTWDDKTKMEHLLHGRIYEDGKNQYTWHRREADLDVVLLWISNGSWISYSHSQIDKSQVLPICEMIPDGNGTSSGSKVLISQLVLTILACLIFVERSAS